ncbi:MAG TPA: O-antigen ligase family protein [Verrucomicrobiota bacterium]|nr:O-antigen ligase family protein [Verrucomicrobiota bacterium]
MAILWITALIFGLSSSTPTVTYGAMASVVGTGVWLVLALLVLFFSRGPLRMPRGIVRYVPVILALAAFNVAVSNDRLQSAGRWGLWLTLVVVAVWMANATGKCTENKMRSKWPWLFAVIYLIIIADVYVSGGNERVVTKRFHLSGLYANLMLGTGLFVPNPRMRTAWIIAGLLGIFFSGSGGAALSLPISVLPYFVFRFRKDAARALLLFLAVAAVGAAGILGAGLGEAFLERKVRGSRAYFSGMERLERSSEGRLLLQEAALEAVRAQPWGTGLGPTYRLSLNFSPGSTHNGLLSTLVELGYAGFTVVLAGLAWILLRILKNPALAADTKALYFTYVATMFARSLSENYMIFDLSSPGVLYFLYLTALYSRGASRGRGRLDTKRRLVAAAGPARRRIPMLAGG